MFEIDLGSKFGMSQHKIGQSVSQQGFFTSHDSLALPCISQERNSRGAASVSTASDMDLLHSKNTLKSRGRLKDLTRDTPLLRSWNPSTSNHGGSQDNPLMIGNSQSNFSGNICNGTDR